MAWELENGPIPTGAHVLHACDEPLCVRPSHLWLGTNDDNIVDRMEKGRSSRKGAAGERNSHAVLTADEVREVRRLCREKAMNRRLIAARFGLTKSGVDHIAARHTWKHVD